MSKVAIVTDSTTNLPGRVGEQYRMHVVPVKIIFDEQSSWDGVDMTPAQFYEMLTQAPELPTEKVVSRF